MILRRLHKLSQLFIYYECNAARLSLTLQIPNLKQQSLSFSLLKKCIFIMLLILIAVTTLIVIRIS